MTSPEAVTAPDQLSVLSVEDSRSDPAAPMLRPAAGVAEPLFYSPGATEGTTQWKAETFQLVNWGGFEGRVVFEFHPGSTLISGASGTGKSTLLDAYIALMMPSDTPFNGASNDVVGGRARTGEKRSLLSYLRGKMDTTGDSDGREIDLVLRGKNVPTWGAVGMTFVGDNGQQFTALRVYYVPARATGPGDITMRMASYSGALDLALLADHAPSRFAPAALKSAFPGLRTHDTYAAFAQTLYTRLGIGANGDGEKALRLLVRIQSGRQIDTVDDLYKQMVLERPATYVAADRALGHFDDLEAAYLAMQTEQAKADMLGPITGRHASMVAAQAEIDTLDTFGIAVTGDSPIGLWTLRKETALLAKAVDVNRDERQQAAEELGSAKSAETHLAGELEQRQEEHRNSGGATLENIGVEIERQQLEREARANRRASLQDQIVALATPLTGQHDFDRLRADGEKFLRDYDTNIAEVTRRRDVLRDRQWPLSERKRVLGEERQSLSGRAGRVPKYLDDMRQAAAKAAGLPVEQLPFVAELIDVAPDETGWRTAIETVLGASARIMLVPDTHLEAFSRAIDPLQLRGRITFEGAPQGPHRAYDGDPRRIAGKLVFKDSPFSGWVQRHLTGPSRNALCVESAQELAGGDYRVTRAGQTRLGSRGTHGRSEQANIIGFSSREAIAELDAEIERIETDLAELDIERRRAESETAQLQGLRDAYRAVRNYAWTDVDTAAIEQRIGELEDRRTRILTSDDRLRALQNTIDHLKEQVDQARQRKYRAEARVEKLNDEHRRLAEREDEVAAQLDAYDAHGRIELTQAQDERLEQEFSAAVGPGDPDSLTDFGINLARLRERLNAALKAANEELERAADELVRIFNSYQLKWEDPNLGTSVASYPDYAAVLDNIVSTGLHQRRDEWRHRLTEWSGQDLVPLAGAMEVAVADIEERLVPINEILEQLPFGAGRDRLRIRLRRLLPDDVKAFRRDLRVLSSGATKDVPEAQMEARFKELQRFMGRIRRREDPRANPQLVNRDRLLDVRRHMEITAVRYDTTGAVLSHYAALGGKSGGETQELVAFIVGAALRFRLGDEQRARPRFAPVFLDEGFVKSDAEFAGRAVSAWKGLGFQLIIGAPLDKVTALEPYMDEMLGITKNTTTGYSFVHPIRDTPDLEQP
jgi:uncharacterized protein YPO0396